MEHLYLYCICFSDCNGALIGDGFCDDQLNHAECNYDGGDCCIEVNTDHCVYFTGCTCHHRENCIAGFIPSVVGDGVCDDETNNADCSFDDGDCCIDINMARCSNCTCHHQENCVAGFIPSVVGDGFCNDETNNADCNYDGGDCCGYDVNTARCSDCKCYHNETCNFGTHPLVADGFCNDETNNADCNYDGGDCCGSCVVTDYCLQCECIGGANVTNVLIANGFCNDKTNNADCNYDGGDCCVDINTNHCSDCTCYHQENCIAGFIPSVVGDGFCNDKTNNADCNYDGGNVSV